MASLPRVERDVSRLKMKMSAIQRELRGEIKDQVESMKLDIEHQTKSFNNMNRVLSDVRGDIARIEIALARLGEDWLDDDEGDE